MGAYIKPMVLYSKLKTIMGELIEGKIKNGLITYPENIEEHMFGAAGILLVHKSQKKAEGLLMAKYSDIENNSLVGGKREMKGERLTNNELRQVVSKEGNLSSVWAEDILTTLTREFHEETCGLIPLELNEILMQPSTLVHVGKLVGRPYLYLTIVALVNKYEMFHDAIKTNEGLVRWTRIDTLKRSKLFREYNRELFHTIMGPLNLQKEG